MDIPLDEVEAGEEEEERLPGGGIQEPYPATTAAAVVAAPPEPDPAQIAASMQVTRPLTKEQRRI